MPLSLSTIAIAEKNKLSTDSRWLVCLAFSIPGEITPVRLVNDNQNLSWKGVIWQAFPFDIEEITDAGKSEIPQVSIRVSNVTRAIEAYLIDYDDYQKQYGYTPIEAEIFVVNTAAIEDNNDVNPEVSHTFMLKQPKADSKWATFILGATNIHSRRFPLNRIFKNHCRYRFKDRRCGYEGADAECNHTLPDCRSKNNSHRFGNAPGAGYNGLNLA